jgi:tetratricopeptide (TPR) repeat protein
MESSSTQSTSAEHLGTSGKTIVSDKQSHSQGDRSSSVPWPRPAWLPFIGLLLLVCGIYANSLRAPFLLDDQLTLIMEPTTHSWTNAAGSAYGRRVGMLTFAANYSWGRTEVFGYHVVNVAIHLAAGSLLWALSRRLLQAAGTPPELSRAAEPLAWCIAALWLVHPLQTNAVTYTVQRFESLASLGMLAALYAVARCAGNSTDQAHMRLANPSATNADGRNASEFYWGAIAVLSGWLATQSKEIAIGLPLLTLTLDRAFFADSWRTLIRRRGWVHAGLATMSGLLIYHTRSAFVAGPAASAGFFVTGLSPWQYIRSQPSVILHYLRLSFWPDHLCIDYGWPVSESSFTIYGYGAIVIAILTASLYAFFRVPRLGFIGLAFFIVLGPTSSFLPIADLAFEHRMYLPLASLATFLVLAVHRCILHARHQMPISHIVQFGSNAARAVNENPFDQSCAWIALFLATVVIGSLGCRTIVRNMDFTNPEKLWRKCIATNPMHVRPRSHLIGQLISKGDLDGAIHEGQAALRLGPYAAELHSQMGTVYMKKRLFDEAERCFRLASEANPKFPMGWFNWATLCFQQSRYRDACRLYRKAIDVHSVHVESWSGLGWSLELLGDSRQAVACYRRALTLDPSLIVVTTRLADLMATSGDDSIRDPAQALRMVEPLARRTRGRNPYILDTLAAALAANGRNSEAVRVAQTALRLSPEKDLRVRIETRLLAYKASKPNAATPPRRNQ